MRSCLGKEVATWGSGKEEEKVKRKQRRQGEYSTDFNFFFSPFMWSAKNNRPSYLTYTIPMGTAELTSATGLDGWTNGFNQRQQQWIELNGASPSPEVRPTASLTASWLADLVLCSSWSAEVTGGGVQQWLFNEQLAPFLAKCQLNANDDDGGKLCQMSGQFREELLLLFILCVFMSLSCPSWMAAAACLETQQKWQIPWINTENCDPF